MLFQVEGSGNEQIDAIISDAKNIENVFDVQRVNPGNQNWTIYIPTQVSQHQIVIY